VIVHTIGHSTLPLADLLGLLAAQGIRNVVDVRRYPASRRHPHFARESLAAALAEAGIAYRWLPGLGGRRSGRRDSPHVAWQSASFRAYADHMETAEFRRELNELIELARTGPTTVMCAEAVPWRCHRQLIADALVARGIDVRHIVGHGDPQEHRLTPFARLDGERVVYDRGQLVLAGAARLSAPDAIGHNPRHRR
jgi:uncharacterized protein (DUF488 family)